MKQLKNFGRLEVIAFISGFSLMAFELIGARMLSPTIGSSTYVWTSVIGVIIAALSIGYFLGGKLADARGRSTDIAYIALASAITIGLMLIMFDVVMDNIVNINSDGRLKGVLASLILFAPTSLLLGILSPYLVKLKVTSLAVSGRSVAGLSACNSIGGIAGTFVTGFIVFSFMGSREALSVIVVLMILSSWLIAYKDAYKVRAVITIIALVFIMAPLLNKERHVTIDTPSAHYEIKTGKLKGDSRTIRYLTSGPGGAQSGVYENDNADSLPFWYTQEIARTVRQLPNKKNVLILGGGAFTLPEYLGKTYPESSIDVVEIDPKLQDIAKQYFRYTPQENVSIIDADARTFVNAAQKKYDVIIVDVYSDTSVPFSLLTQEYSQELAKISADNGSIVVNAIAALKGSCQSLLGAVDAVYRPITSFAYIAQAEEVTPEMRANRILTYTKRPLNGEGRTPMSLISSPQYTDNFMPAESIQQACNESA